MSDCRELQLNFSVFDNERRKGYWKLNTSLLECNQYKGKLSKIIVDISKEEGSSINK